MATTHTPTSLLAVLALVLCGYAMTSMHFLGGAVLMARKMRWFFIAILVTCFWLTPGDPLYAGASHMFPSREGLVLGLQRVLSLLTVLLTVNLLLLTTRRDELVSAIIWLSAPLAVFGLSRERLAVRLVLTLQAVHDVQPLLDYAKPQGGKVSTRLAAVSGMAKSLGSIYDRILSRVDEMQPQILSVPVPAAPPLQQWLLVPVITGLLWLANAV